MQQQICLFLAIFSAAFGGHGPIDDTSSQVDTLASELKSSRRQATTMTSQLKSSRRQIEEMKNELAALRELVAYPLGMPVGVTSKMETVIGSEEVAVRKSALRGLGRGAFSLRTFKEGDVVGIYKCLHVKLSAANMRTSWEVNATHWCDASLVPVSNPLLYVNSISTFKTCALQNLEMRKTEETGEFSYVAVADIAVGDELFVDYGANYFRMASPRLATTYECHMPELSAASARGDLPTVLRLLEHNGTAVYSTSEDGWTPLMEACATGQRRVVKVLLEWGGVVKYADEAHQTALFVAAHHGFDEVIELLIDNADLGDTAGVEQLVNPEVMVAGARSGKVEVLEALLEFGPPDGTFVNLAIPESGETPLLSASRRGHVEMVKALLERGAEPNRATNHVGATPLFLAAEHRQLGVVEVLVGDGGGGATVDGGATVSGGTSTTWGVLVDQARADTGSTPLFVAAQKGYADVVKVLVRAGADVDKPRTKDGTTPLCMAANFGHGEVVEALLQGGVDVDQGISGTGVTPLFLAAQNGHVSVVEALLDAGADPHLSRVGDGETPFSISVLNGHRAVSNLLQ